MNKCINCGVEFVDPTSICPLCKCVTENDGDLMRKPTYPRTDKEMKKIQIALNIYTFVAIVAEVLFVLIDLKTGDNFWWSIMLGAFLVYGFITLKFSVQKHIGYQFKMLLQTLLGVSVLVLIDYLLGFHRWSLNYVLPSAFILIDVSVIVLMIVNNRNWQSYIPMQILIIVLSIIPFILRFFRISTDSILCLISLLVAILVFVGTMVVGGKRARAELYRRFHV
jgi:hypothetical protein